MGLHHEHTLISKSWSALASTVARTRTGYEAAVSHVWSATAGAFMLRLAVEERKATA
jgi:hypothetical protein